MKKREMKKVKESGTPGRINHNKSGGAKSRKRKDHRLRKQTFETKTEECRKRSSSEITQKNCVSQRRSFKMTVSLSGVLKQREKPCVQIDPLTSTHTSAHTFVQLSE